ncbi:MAG: hypothetical protein INH41_10990 [Myxococcaceae bacterium]|jgi:hypothetical protein|nr:hypothetical protein [Myxococcaceae bacterium]MCA3012912.1 hypothetical protein [Myxococcaceae bacterium]
MTLRLFWRIWKDRKGTAAAVAACSLGLWVVLVSGYHGNTDCVGACLVLLAAWQLEREKPLLAGCRHSRLVAWAQLVALVAALVRRAPELRTEPEAHMTPVEQ